MAQTDISPEKIDAYRKTEYRFGDGPKSVTLRIDEHSGALARIFSTHSFESAVFITAYNPFGIAEGDEANNAAHQELGRELRALSSVVIEGEGVDPSGAWPAEKSFLALGVNLGVARSLGRRHRQDAVVWVGPDAVPTLTLLR